MIGLLIVFVAFASAKEFYKYTFTVTVSDTIITSYSVYEVGKCYRISTTTYQLISQQYEETTADEGKYFYGIFKDKECTTPYASSDVKQYTVEELKTYTLFETKPDESNQCKEVAASQFVDDKCEEPISDAKQFVCNDSNDVNICIRNGNDYIKPGVVVHGYQGTFHYSDNECKEFTGYVENPRKCGVCSPLAIPNSAGVTTYIKVTCENDC
ncbi:hypothetical protein ENUP19_0163G0056 [Entamoeba nuttalli]|uniref:Uncharacterized protein n=1 Tax=Entamoeba nuttalli TaxID=412467 RepID=A0ABQ0DM02_9EUKA